MSELESASASESTSSTPPPIPLTAKVSLWTKALGMLPLMTPLALIALKLLGVRPMANWSWKWITSPFWISGILGVFYMGAMAAIFYFAAKGSK